MTENSSNVGAFSNPHGNYSWKETPTTVRYVYETSVILFGNKRVVDHALGDLSKGCIGIDYPSYNPTVKLVVFH